MADTAKLSHQQCTKAIKAAYKNNVRRVAGSNTSPYWWNDTISTKRTECTSARRTLTRLARNNSVPDIVKTEAQKNYRMLKKQLCKLIRQEKRKQWLTLCKKLEEDIWGDGYRIAVRELKNLTPYDIPSSKKAAIIKELFVTDELGSSSDRSRNGMGMVTSITDKELQQATSDLKSGKARTIMLFCIVRTFFCTSRIFSPLCTVLCLEVQITLHSGVISQRQ
ncbi:hypothetical protein QE152_g5519 [Popillia japonica]|uniref:Uncharacterized protein n=1 Tax=Popillia japonica TaxID=7064 RepID=A0AAW1MIB5_POPJA